MTLGEDAQTLSAWGITFTDVLTGNEYIPAGLIKVNSAKPVTGENESLSIVHITKQGKLEFIDANISSGNLEFISSDFSEIDTSVYALAKYSGQWEDLLPAQSDVPKKANLTWLWLSLAGVSAVGLTTLVFVKKRRSA